MSLMLTFGSVCSGIEAASVAWSPLGWKSAFFSEIEAFPSAVLSYRHPDTPNLGDMTKFKEWPDAAIDVLVGGTPCQSFSVAGLRKGLDDPRGNLMLTYLAIADRYRPRWLVWENVPGVLSSNGGRDFAAFLFGLGECGYGFAYRVLDAQYFGLAQRRKRVFVVASARGWQSAAAVLFERASLSGNPAPRRESRQAVAGSVVASAGVSCPPISPALKARDYKGPSSDGDGDGDGAPLITHTLRGAGFDANATAAVLAFDTTPVTSKGNVSNPKPGDACHPLAAGAHAPAIAFTQVPDCLTSAYGTKWNGNASANNGSLFALSPAVAIAADCYNGIITGDVAATLTTQTSGGISSGPSVLTPPTMQVRRLTPRECERLQGFPDDYTAIPWRKKTAAQCPDGPRYKSLGNSMAVPVMRWIGERIDLVEEVRSAA
jgi:DNA (cytosine-5)-methyltransferase 1